MANVKTSNELEILTSWFIQSTCGERKKGKTSKIKPKLQIYGGRKMKQDEWSGLTTKLKEQLGVQGNSRGDKTNIANIFRVYRCRQTTDMSQKRSLLILNSSLLSKDTQEKQVQNTHNTLHWKRNTEGSDDTFLRAAEQGRLRARTGSDFRRLREILVNK